MMKKIFLMSLVFIASLGFSQIPNGYYDNAQGLTGESLRTALSNIITNNYDQQSYDDLWSHFQQTDKKANGKVWDMYSTREDGSFAYEYTFVSDQCGNYSGEGSCYNREHSFPKSWFDDDYPMYSDLFHLYPTDGKVNGQRGNLPYGEVGTADWTSTNGSLRGNCTYPGYTGTVFEPIDEFKGDFARSYFYMLTRYKSQISTWSSAMLSGDNFSSWAEAMLLEWNALDPVSPKETARNNAVYLIQGNRNPYIDNPEWAIAVWAPESLTVKELDARFNIWYSKSNLQWTSNYNIENIEIYNVLGQKLKSIDIEQNEQNSKLDLQPGIYIANIKADKSFVLKFVVK